MNPKVDEYLGRVQNWKEEMEQLRSILLACGLTEELKWRVPCYTFHDSNIVLIGGFKEFFTLSFFKGVLLNDEEQILVSPGENSQTVRMIKFTDITEIAKLETVIKNYVFEAIEIEKAGIKVEKKDNTELVFPEELISFMEKNLEFKDAFEALTPGRQRAYNMFFTAPKQSKTRETRIEKNMDRIIKGFGLNDCTCGLTKRKPNCDGSHKALGL